MFDGSGGEFDVAITHLSRGSVRVRTEQFDNTALESPFSIHLLQGVSRGDRMDTVVQKSTELGVTRISPVLTDFAVVQLDQDRAAKRMQHWTRVAQSACEQCGRNVVPAIDAPASFADWMDVMDALPQQKFVLHPGAPDSLAEINMERRETVLLIGPEGGLSPMEMERASAAGFQSVSMGPRIMRTETAAIASIAILQSRFGDI